MSIMRIKGQPDEIKKVFNEVVPMLENKNNIKIDLDIIYVYSRSSWFIRDLAEHLSKLFKLISISWITL